MNKKLKAWQIGLLAIFAIMFAAIASIFSLKATTVDEEETPEELVDNWSLDVIFYDSSVDGGKTPLTEINWDATDGSYKAGTTRVITVQINYKNTNTITRYDIGELEIKIPNLIYNTNQNTSAQWTTSVIVGANDASHTNYDWDFITGEEPTNTQEYYSFTNTNIIEEKANLEGSIQIQYTITPSAESPESYLEECIHNYNKTIQATLINRIKPTTITSPSYPNNYSNNLSESNCFWEYTNNNEGIILINFDSSSKTESCDYINIYDIAGNKLFSLSGTAFAGKSYEIDKNYIKITMSTDNSVVYKGFSANIYKYKVITNSNEIKLSYTRTYVHPWQHRQIYIYKYASALSSLDGLPQGEYYWVKYTFNLSGSRGASYPYTGLIYYIEDNLPTECIVLNHNFEQLTLENGYYKNSSFSDTTYSYSLKEYLYVGYPKSIYNEEARNLNITNHVDLYVKHGDTTEYELHDDAEVNINLADFDFNYSGDLYSISKSSDGYGTNYSDIFLNPNFTHACSMCNTGHITTRLHWKVFATAIYTGTPLTVQTGDDLMYISAENGNYRKLNDNEYWFDCIYLPYIKNKNGINVGYNKYPSSLYVRYSGEKDYVFYSSLEGKSGGSYIEFNTEKKVVGFYIQIEDMTESMCLSNSQNWYGSVRTQVKPLSNIADSGKVYNFSFLKAYYKDENGNLILQNEPELQNYSTITTQDNIAQYDLDTYGHYVQRAEASKDFSDFVPQDIRYQISSLKTIDKNIIQDAENELFIVNTKIGSAVRSRNQYYNLDNNYIQTVFLDYYDEMNLLGKYEVYDLLPKGMELISTKEELLNSITSTSSNAYNYCYNINGTKPFSNNQELIDFIKSYSSIKIEENWNNTGRTKVTWITDFSENPILFIHDSGNSIPLYINLESKISYDSYLEYGAVWNNYSYAIGYHNTGTLITISSENSTTDNGKYDIDASDINENSLTIENISYVKASATINSVISTHQDLTVYAQTNYNNYSTKIVDTLCNSEYEYKLRVRTGSADVTNLVIYTSIEEAQPERTRWKGEFLGIDTSYAESKGYAIKVWYSENTTIGTLIEDTSWKEYSDDIDKTKVKSLAFQYLSSTAIVDTENTSAAILPANTLTYVLIKMKSPNDESLTTLARMDCWTEWNAIDEFGNAVDFITGINSNVVKVALPNSVKTDDMPSISLKFTKEITGSETDFENMLLKKANEQIFMIRLTSLTANDDGTYNQVTGMLSSNTGLIISQIPIGTYLLEELGDNYFNFVDFTNNNDSEIIIEGVTFEQTDQGYIIIVSETLTETIEFNIKVTNEIEDERFFEDKDNKENLFLKNKIEADLENPI